MVVNEQVMRDLLDGMDEPVDNMLANRLYYENELATLQAPTTPTGVSDTTHDECAPSKCIATSRRAYVRIHACSACLCYVCMHVYRRMCGTCMHASFPCMQMCMQQLCTCILCACASVCISVRCMYVFT